ncbi:MAG: helix-turn-helix domain-containing protein [Clostridia bacterium]|nr:helix-turn-helix domain-containing protein [Clostridia bacterium]
MMKRFEVTDKLGIVVERSVRETGTHEPEHTHDFIELVYTAAGNGTHYINGIPYPARRGDLLFINYGEVHAITVDSTLTFYQFLVKPEFIAENFVNSENIDDIFLLFLPEGAEELQRRKTSCVRFFGAERTEIEHLIANMHKEAEEKKPCHRFVLNGYMQLLFSKLIRALMESSATYADRAQLLTEEILAYLDEHFTGPVTADALAKHCFYNPAYLGRVFKAVYGKSLKEYIRERRMEYAAELLSDGKLSVDEVIERVGYTGKGQFYKHFYAHFGTSPGKF